VNILDPTYLFASLVWGSVGVGYLIYGRKQGAIAPFVGGVAMILVSYFVGSALLMSVIGLALMFTVYRLMRQG